MTDTSALSERGNGAEVGTALAPRDRTGGLVQGQPTKAAAGSSVEDFFVIVVAGQGGCVVPIPGARLIGCGGFALLLLFCGEAKLVAADV